MTNYSANQFKPLQSESLKLSELLAGIADLSSEQDTLITGLSLDSRRVTEGGLFCALSGLSQHGLQFLPQVQKAGASAVVWEPPYNDKLSADNIYLIEVPALRQHLSVLADRFYQYPAQDITLIGVTGTDGKTSCAYYLAQALSAEKGCGLCGTLGHGVFGAELTGAGLTTPDVIALRQWLATVRDHQARFAVMEVSSHALDQGRVQGLPFDIAVLTNLGRDHLDYHQSLEHYSAAKKRLFSDYGARLAVLNADDEFGLQLAAQFNQDIIFYSCQSHFQINKQPYIWAQDVRLSGTGLELELQSSWGSGQLKSELFGRFNASNLLAVLATLMALEMPWQEALQRLSVVRNAPGRMERVSIDAELDNVAKQPLVLVDYAHTPQALEQALRALHEHSRQRIWCVFGCGGDRDPGKRPLMGAVAERLADQIVITDDNPRTEDPAQIIAQIQAGLAQPQRAFVVPGREQAIHYALHHAQANDIVLLAGKGHEDYQLIDDQRLDFDDRAIARACLRELVA